MSIPTVALIDGFNLYHAVKALRADHLKWLDLRALCTAFAPTPQYALGEVLYFTAYATWLPRSRNRHKAYTKALEASGVTVKTAKFKRKDRRCYSCGSSWTDHEEKETDVAIGVSLLDLAYRGAFERALLVTNDSDLVPAVRLVRERFPKLTINMLTPPNRHSSRELIAVSGGSATMIQRIHLERALLPAELVCTDGSTATRPAAYDPPQPLA